MTSQRTSNFAPPPWRALLPEGTKIQPWLETLLDERTQDQGEQPPLFQLVTLGLVMRLWSPEDEATCASLLDSSYKAYEDSPRAKITPWFRSLNPSTRQAIMRAACDRVEELYAILIVLKKSVDKNPDSVREEWVLEFLHGRIDLEGVAQIFEGLLNPFELGKVEPNDLRKSLEHLDRAVQKHLLMWDLITVPFQNDLRIRESCRTGPPEPVWLTNLLLARLV